MAAGIGDRVKATRNCGIEASSASLPDFSRFCSAAVDYEPNASPPIYTLVQKLLFSVLINTNDESRVCQILSSNFYKMA